MNKYEILKEYFGYSSFREGQEKIIDLILSARDVLAVMPTGAGKSLCFQVPALMKSGVCLVISPLISLMKDQIYSLKENGIEADTVNSSLESDELEAAYRNVCTGKCKILYISPERLDSERFLNIVKRIKVSMVCIDEAHCVSQWGQDFRSSYLRISGFISSLKNRPPVAAFTATATQRVREDIIKLLGLNNPETIVTGFDRKNLFFSVVSGGRKLEYIENYLNSHRSDSGIIYCSTRKNVERICDSLDSRGFSVTRYHAGLGVWERKHNQELFIKDDRKIIVATNAFGMGIDKSNVRFVIHYNMPGEIESYYQEAGRAGRDGENADCILLYSKGDIRTQKYFINNPTENLEISEKEAEELRIRRLYMLRSMIQYCESEECLRKTILNYFGQQAEEKCSGCSVCCGHRHYRDVTVEAQKILSAVVRTREKQPIYVIIDLLCGDEAIGEFDEKLKQIKTYGAMKGTSKQRINEIIEYLISGGFLKMENDLTAPGILHIGEGAKEVLFGSKQVLMEVGNENNQTDAADGLGDEALFSLLKTTRKKLADSRGVPAFVIFSDATLREMSRKAPVTVYDFRKIKGVGERKCQQYAGVFLKAIALYKESKAAI